MIQFQNWYEATLTSPITSTSLNIPLTPVPPIVTEGILVIDYDNPSLREIIHFTSKDGVSVNCPSTGDTGTLNTGRGYESTTARNHAQNAKVRMVLTAGVASAIQTAAVVIANQNNNGGWVARSETPVYASNNGQREFTFTVPGDLTGVIWQGMKVKMDRVVAPPTQAMSFTAASSQYATKASPVGFSFTNTMTAEAWVYINSYPGIQGVISRYSVPGFIFQLSSAGQVNLYCEGSGFRQVQSCQSIPLKRWLHIAASITMSTGTGAIYINGTLVPSAITGSSTALVQAGNLQIGAYNSINPLDGYVTEARIWSVVQTQSQIQSNMFINLIGNEANLVFCARGAGDWTDRTVNANNLTATNGATFVTLSTLPSSYFNATEQFIVNGKPVYNAPNTTITAFGGTDFGLPSSGGLTNFYFSSQRAPYGFPASKGKWTLIALCGPESLVAGTVTTSVYSYGFPGSVGLTVPIGDWTVAMRGTAGEDGTSGGRRDTKLGLTTATPAGGFTTFSDPDLFQTANGNGATFLAWPFAVSKSVSHVSQTTYTVAGQTPSASGNLFFNPGGTANGFIFVTAESAYI